jgi:hypothetical protein
MGIGKLTPSYPIGWKCVSPRLLYWLRRFSQIILPVYLLNQWKVINKPNHPVLKIFIQKLCNRDISSLYHLCPVIRTNDLHPSPVIQAPQVAHTFAVVYPSNSFRKNRSYINHVYLSLQIVHMLILWCSIGHDNLIYTGCIDKFTGGR